jgi:hypothetical protein
MPIGLVRLIPNAGFLPSDIFETNNGAAPKLLLLAQGRPTRPKLWRQLLALTQAEAEILASPPRGDEWERPAR